MLEQYIDRYIFLIEYRAKMSWREDMADITKEIERVKALILSNVEDNQKEVVRLFLKQ